MPPIGASSDLVNSKHDQLASLTAQEIVFLFFSMLRITG
jgi:hypothetical protein